MSTHIGYRNLSYVPSMGIPEDKSERLKQARIAAGYLTSAEAADALGMSRQTYFHHEAGTRQYREEEAIRYARKFKVRPEWLLLGIERDESSTKAVIREIDTRAGAGGGGIADLINVTDSSGNIVSAEVMRPEGWMIPEGFMRGELRVDPAGALIIEVSGDSGYDPHSPNAPGSIFPGDRVIVDTRDKRPSPPGPFLIHDGIGLVVKLCEPVHGSDPVRIRLSSRNPSYEPYEVTEGEGIIIGRVRGRISAM